MHCGHTVSRMKRIVCPRPGPQQAAHQGEVAPDPQPHLAQALVRPPRHRPVSLGHPGRRPGLLIGHRFLCKPTQTRTSRLCTSTHSSSHGQAVCETREDGHGGVLLQRPLAHGPRLLPCRQDPLTKPEQQGGDPGDLPAGSACGSRSAPLLR